MSDIIYVPNSKVVFCTNTFEDVRVILKYNDTPLIEVVHEEAVGYTVAIPIYHSDGTYLAKVVGSRLFSTQEGEKAGVVLRHPVGMTICELQGKPILELRRTEAASLKTDAELYTPDGSLLKSWNNELTGTILRSGGEPWLIKGCGRGALIMDGSTVECKGTAINISPEQALFMRNSVIRGADIGVHITSQRAGEK